MLVKNDIKGESYIELVNYFFKKCNIMSVSKYTTSFQINNEKLDIILKSCGYTKEYIINNFSYKLLKKIYISEKENNQLFDSEYKKRETEDYNQNCFFRELTIKEILSSFFYNYMVKKWIFNHKNDIFFEKDEYNCGGTVWRTVYFLKLTDDIKKEILEKKSIYYWKYPYYVEDLSFYKNKTCLLESTTHENICHIYCKDEQEYEYLKSIGIKFVDNEFKPISKDKLHFENY